MKKSILFAVFCACLLHITAASPLLLTHEPEVKVIITARRIWLVTDEIPVKNLHVQVFNPAGKMVLEQTFSSKNANWSLDLQSLPTGYYSVAVGTQAPVNFKK